VAGRVLYDLGDFLDDYRTDPLARNDLGLLWLVDLERGSTGEWSPRRLEALPLKLEYCHTRLADRDDRDWIAHRLRAASAALGGPEVRDERGRLVAELA
jgi:poly-gamma-glutamate synthesis protein (capsule biosynthesis protein)